jgi:nitric oxide reductase NorE protein
MAWPILVVTFARGSAGYRATTDCQLMVDRAAPAMPKVPGEAGLWIFILGDMLVFGAVFCTYLFYRADAPEAYARSQALLSRDVGAFNTVVLLTSSWFIAAAVQDAQNGRTRTIARKLCAGWCCGVLFIILKLTEYGQKFHAGISAATNDFFMFYFVLTGIHFLHVLIGLAVIGYFWRHYSLGRAGVMSPNHLESGGVFWHLVDLLWIILFPLLYLIR